MGLSKEVVDLISTARKHPTGVGAYLYVAPELILELADRIAQFEVSLANEYNGFDQWYLSYKEGGHIPDTMYEWLRDCWNAAIKKRSAT